MCTYKSQVFGAKTLEIILVFYYHAHLLLLQMLLIISDIFHNAVHIILNKEPQIEKIILHLNKIIHYMFMFIENIQD